MEKKQIVAALEEIADLMEVRGDDPFRVRSFRGGARAVEALSEDLAARVEDGTLDDVPGIGKTIAGVIAELVRSGRSARLDELRAVVPAGLLELHAIPGLGPKRALVLHQRLGVASLDELERACREGRVAGLPGFGKKTEEKILAGIAYRRAVGGRFLIVEAVAAAEPLLEHLREEATVDRVEIGGSLRRRRETVKDIDYLAVLRKGAVPGPVMERFVSWKGVDEVLARGPTKSSVRLRGGIQADLRVVEREAFPSALQYFTGSKEHNTVLRGLAKDLGFKLNEYGLFEVRNGEERRAPCRDEAAIYRTLGLDWIPPELREDMGEFDLARAGRLPRLVELEDLRGIVHVHTTASDGRESLEAMAAAAREMGFEYLGVTDHSRSAAYAGGLDEAAIREQHREIDRLNARLEGFRIFKGIESDILADGSLDYPPEVLDRFDFVIASVHSGFQLAGEEQTRRIIRALGDPHTTYLAHPTGRLLLSREGYAVDMERVLRAAGELGVTVEINAHPRRLDLDWRWGRFAREHGVRTAIHPDAHESAGYRDVVFGIGIARKAGFEAADVVNTYPVAEFERFIARRKVTH